MLLYVNVLPPLLLYKIVSLNPISTKLIYKKYLENYLYCNPQRGITKVTLLLNYL
jgi:hypothetical protein